MSVGDETYGKIEVVGKGDVTVGKYCSLASGIKAVFLQDHRVDWISTFPFSARWSMTSIQGHPVNPQGILIGNDVWVGSNVVLLGGCSIDDGAVIGAYSVVAGHIPPYSVAVGNPARVVRKRFDEETISRLLKVSWWDWPKDKIRESAAWLCSPNVERIVEL